MTVGNRRVLITGIAGFLGRNLAGRFLELDAEVHGVVRESTDRWRLRDIARDVNIHIADLRDFDTLNHVVSAIRPEVTFNAAMEGGHPRSHKERTRSIETGVLGTANLLEATAHHEYIKFVHVGSSLEYGPRDHPLKETDLLEPTTSRGVAKAATALICGQFARSHRRPIVLVRPFSIYGPWETGGRLIPTLISAATRMQSIKLTAPGYRRDFVFVDDVVDACLRLLQVEGMEGEVFNVGSGVQTANERIAALVVELMDVDVPIEIGAHPGRPSDTAFWVADVEKIRRATGWVPLTDVRKGLEKTIEWWHARRDLLAHTNPSA